MIRKLLGIALILNLFFVSAVHAQENIEEHFFSSYKVDVLKEYFALNEIKIERPVWRKLDLINQDERFYKKEIQHNLELDHPVTGVIFELSKVRDSDLFSFNIENQEGQTQTYHNVREILYPQVDSGSYKFKLNSNTFEQIALKIFEADRVYPNKGILVLNKDDAQFEAYQEQIEGFISRGGVLVNLASEEIHDFMINRGTKLQEIALEGEKSQIKYAENYYFYIPRDLFLHEETALRVVNAIKEQLGLEDHSKGYGQSTFVAIILLFLAGLTFYRKKESIKEWLLTELKPLIEKLAKGGIIIAIFLVILIPFAIFLYKNYSGLDLFPNLTIDQLINTFQLKLIAKLILLLIAFIVILYAFLIAFVDKEESLLERAKHKLATLVKPNKENKKETAFLLIIAFVTVGVFVSSFFGNEKGKNAHPQRVYDQYSARIDEFPKQIEVNSKIPLVYRFNELNEHFIADTFPAKQSIEAALANENGEEETVKNIYSNLKHAQFFAYFKERVKGEITLRNQNYEFGNKDLFIHLVDLDGKHKATMSIQGEKSLLGETGKFTKYEFRLTVPEPGIYGIKLENSDSLREGDYELVSIKANTNRLYSYNEIQQNPISHTFSLELEEGTEFTIEPYQFEKLNKQAFWITN